MKLRGRYNKLYDANIYFTFAIPRILLQLLGI